MANSNTGNNVTGNMMPGSVLFPEENFNTTLKPGLNPGDFYGINGDVCSAQGCVPNVVNQEQYTIPSLQEIASYNNQIIRGEGVGNSPAVSAETAQQNMQNGMSGQNMIPSTPATTFNYGATIDENLQNEMTDGITDIRNPYPVTPESLQYLNGFLRTQIGRRVSIDFLVGSNSIVTKSGFLLGVASNYILINELDTNDLTTCDFYNIKFIRFYY